MKKMLERPQKEQSNPSEVIVESQYLLLLLSI